MEFKEKYCGQCGKTEPASGTHTCNYCNMTPEMVFDKVENTYMKLNNRKINKSQAKNIVQPLYNAMNGRCPVLKRKMNNDSRTREKIERYYQTIIDY